MSIHVKQHMPGFVHGFVAGEADVESAEYITRLEFIARWEKDNSEELFYQWSLDGHWLIAEYNDGRVWYVTARLSSDDFQPIIRFFPKWVPNRTPAVAKDTSFMSTFYKIPQEHPGYAQLLTAFAASAAPIAHGDAQRVVVTVKQAFNNNDMNVRRRLQQLVEEQVDHWALLVLTAGSLDKLIAYSARIRKDQAEIALLNYAVDIDDRTRGETGGDEEAPYFPARYVEGQPLHFQMTGKDGHPIWWRFVVIKRFTVLDTWRSFCLSTNLKQPEGEERTPEALRNQAREFLGYLRDMNYIIAPIVPVTVSLDAVMDPRNG